MAGVIDAGWRRQVKGNKEISGRSVCVLNGFVDFHESVRIRCAHAEAVKCDQGKESQGMCVFWETAVS